MRDLDDLRAVRQRVVDHAMVAVARAGLAEIGEIEPAMRVEHDVVRPVQLVGAAAVVQHTAPRRFADRRARCGRRRSRTTPWRGGTGSPPAARRSRHCCRHRTRRPAPPPGRSGRRRCARSPARVPSGSTRLTVWRSISTSTTEPSRIATGPSGKHSPVATTRNSLIARFPRCCREPSRSGGEKKRFGKDFVLPCGACRGSAADALGRPGRLEPSGAAGHLRRLRERRCRCAARCRPGSGCRWRSSLPPRSASLAFRHTIAFCVVWLLLAGATLEMTLADIVGPAAFESTIAAVKSAELGLALLCVVRYGLYAGRVQSGPGLHGDVRGRPGVSGCTLA